jgi:putative ABC transport system permease protein
LGLEGPLFPDYAAESVRDAGGGRMLRSLICLSFLVAYAFGLPTILRMWSMFLAFGVSLGVGLVFGTYPAMRAARMDPIEALRHN